MMILHYYAKFDSKTVDLLNIISVGIGDMIGKKNNLRLVKNDPRTMVS